MKTFCIRVNGKDFLGYDPNTTWGASTPHVMDGLLFGDKPRFIDRYSLRGYLDSIMNADRHDFIDVHKIEIETFDL